MGLCIAGCAVDWSRAAGQAAYPDPPEVLREAVSDLAADLATAEEGETEDLAANALRFLTLYTIADALSAEELSRFRFAGEGARTDKQIGAPAGAPGSTTLNQKASLPDLIALAVEYGAVERAEDGTSVTLSTTPYALLLPWSRDDPNAYRRYAFWRRWAVSATFDVGEDMDTEFSQIGSWSLRFRAFGDRSLRSDAYTELWRDTVAPLVRDALVAEAEAMQTLLATEALGGRSQVELATALNTRLEPLVSAGERLEAAAFEAEVYAFLRTNIYDRVVTEPDFLPEAIREELLERAFPRITATQDALTREMSGRLETVAEAMEAIPVLTVAFTRTRVVDEEEGDLSKVQLLFSGRVEPFNVVVDAGVDLRDEVDEAVGHGTLRAAAAGFTLKGEIDNYLGGVPALDVRKISLSAGARYERMVLDGMEDVDVWLAQARIELPVGDALSLPISVTYANRTSLIDESVVRGNLGLTLDFDKLFAAGKGR